MAPRETEIALLPESSSPSSDKIKALAIVDPLSSGALLAQLALDRGYAVIRILSTSFSPDVLAMLPASCKNLRFAATIQHKGDIQATLSELKSLVTTHRFDLQGMTCGCESGVELCDALSARYGGLKSNGEALSHHRRDKYLMGEQVRAAGLRAAQQIETNTWADVEAFATTLTSPQTHTQTDTPPKHTHTHTRPLKMVLKPVRSAGTEDVYFVSSLAEAKQAFTTILSHTNLFGENNDKVLCQEFLAGAEYVVDCVSKDGVHKNVAIWHYDKRPLNGSKFVYFGVNIYESADGEKERKMAEYIFKVLDALGVKEGPSHAEVMWLEDEEQPCLVEVGARPHGGEGTFTELSTPCVGYNQLEVTLDALLPESTYTHTNTHTRGEGPVEEGKGEGGTYTQTHTHTQGRFESLPVRPGRLVKHAREVVLVSREEGIFRGWRMLDEVRGLRSFKSMELKIVPGEKLQLTLDFLTTPGSVMLVHEDAKVVEEDYDLIHQWEEEGCFYEVEPLVGGA